nr:F-box/kelch-repeat protein At5g60570 [Ipomoea batatas]
MNHPRCLFASGSLGSIAIVAGGSDKNGIVTDSLTCGEEFDLKTRKWRKIEGMYPNVNRAAQAPPLVAVVRDQLFAVESCGERLLIVGGQRGPEGEAIVLSAWSPGSTMKDGTLDWQVVLG